MFHFSLTPEAEMIRETAKTFSREQLKPLAREHEKTRRISAAVRAKYAEAGFILIDRPEANGGIGLGSLVKAVVLDELAFGDTGAAFALELPSMMAGPDGSSIPVIVDTDCRLKRDGRTLAGNWPIVFAETHVPVIVIREGAALTVTGNISATAAEPGALHAAPCWKLTFDGSRIENEIPAAGILNRLRLYLSALLCGCSRAALDYAATYVQERRAFGKPLSHHQGVAFIVAEMAARTEAARLALWKAGWRTDEGEDPTFDCAAAFLEAAECGLFVTNQAVQLLGGHGYMKDHLVEKFFREARALSLLGGGMDHALMDAGPLSLSLSSEIGFPRISGGAAR